MQVKAKRTALFLAFLLLCAAIAYYAKPRWTAETRYGSSPLETTRSEPASAVQEFSTGTNGRPLFLTGKVNGKPAQFLIDTGASRTGLDLSFRRILGKPVGMQAFETPSGSVERELFNSPDIQLGDLHLQSKQPVFCQDCRELGVATGVDFAGLIGMDVLKQYVVQIDFDEGLVRLSAALPQPPQQLGTAVRLDYLYGVPCVTAHAGSVPAAYQLDTGSTNNCIADAAFIALAEQRELDTGSSYNVVTAAGGLRTTPGLLHSLTLGNHVHKNLYCNSNPRNVLGYAIYPDML